jgi:hypothetical protein
MKKICFAGAVCLVLILASGVQATTTFWITNNSNGTTVPVDPISGYPELKVNVGSPVTVYTFIDTTDTGNGMEMFVGYDKSDATTFGQGKDTNNGAFKDLVLSSSEDNMGGFFLNSHNVKTDASSREANNPLFGGRLYGVAVTGVTTATTFSNLKCATLTFTNNLVANESTYIVLSNNGSGASWTDFWANGITYLARPSYVLKVTATPEPISLVLLALGGLGLLRKRN